MKTKSKIRLMVVSALLLIVAVAMTWPTQQAESVEPFQASWRTTYDYLLDDSTAAPGTDTTGGIAGTSEGKLFKFTRAKQQSNIAGYMRFYYDNLDTTAAGAVGDTATDSVRILWYTEAEGDTLSYKAIFDSTIGTVHVQSAIVAADYFAVDFSSDPLRDFIYCQLITTCLDSTGAKVAAAVSIDYTVDCKLWAR